MKNTTRILRLLPGAAVLALAACASDPVSYYTLTPAQGEAAGAQPFAGQPLIEVLAVNVPPQIDLPQLVVRTGAGQVRSLDGHRWVGPLPDEFRGALSQALSARLGVPAVQGLRAQADAPVWRILVDVQRFETVAGESVELDAVWRARLAPDGLATPVCRSRLRHGVGPGTAAAVQGHQQNIQALAGAIAQILAGPPGSRPRCPD
ncbi:PqiC family protein [Orrella sp. JC864]|uniref:PqiC family protein n=1 Tax=Orrella sp. JC864 TaxID=3120298 RepID=UPI00300965C9